MVPCREEGPARGEGVMEFVVWMGFAWGTYLIIEALFLGGPPGDLRDPN